MSHLGPHNTLNGDDHDLPEIKTPEKRPDWCQSANECVYPKCRCKEFETDG